MKAQGLIVYFTKHSYDVCMPHVHCNTMLKNFVDMEFMATYSHRFDKKIIILCV